MTLTQLRYIIAIAKTTSKKKTTKTKNTKEKTTKTKNTKETTKTTTASKNESTEIGRAHV